MLCVPREDECGGVGRKAPNSILVSAFLKSVDQRFLGVLRSLSRSLQGQNSIHTTSIDEIGGNINECNF